MFNIITAAVIAASSLTPTSSVGWVCPTLDANPTESGMWDVVAKAGSKGLLTESGGEAIATEIANNCPEYIPIAREWASNQ